MDFILGLVVIGFCFFLIAFFISTFKTTVENNKSTFDETSPTQPSQVPNAESEILLQNTQFKNEIDANKEYIQRLENELEIAKCQIRKLESTCKEKDTQIKLMNRDLAYAKSQGTQYFTERTQLAKKYKAAMSELETRITKEVSERTQYLKESIKPHPELLSAFYKLCDMEAYQKSIMQGGLQRAFIHPPAIEEIGICAIIHSTTTEELYFTSLQSCTCKDHAHRHRPCKHMLYLAYLLGLLQIDQKDYKHLVEEYNDLTVQIAELKEEIEEERQTKDKLISLMNQVIRVINEAPNCYSRLAGVMSDLVLIEFAKSDAYLRIKHPRAKKAHEEVADLRVIAHEATRKYKELEYKMGEIKALFPNIEDILNKDFRIDDFELETCEDKEPTAKQKKDYISKHLNTEKYLRAKRRKKEEEDPNGIL